MDHLADAPIANILILAGVIFLAVGIFGRIGGFIGSIFGNIEAGKNSRVLAGVLGVSLIVGGAWRHQASHKSAASNPLPASPAAGTTPAPSATSPPATAPTAAPTPVAGTSAPSPVPPGTTPASLTSKVPTSPAKMLAPKSQGSAKAVTPETAAAVTPPNIPTPSPSADASEANVTGGHTPTSGPTSVGNDRLIGTWTNLPDGGGIKRIEIVRVGPNLDAHFWRACTPRDCDDGTHKLGTSGNRTTFDVTSGSRHMAGSMNVFAPGVLLMTVGGYDSGTQLRWRNNKVMVKSTLSDKLQGAFARYLTAPGQKAFALHPKGGWSYQFKAASTGDAARKALQNCEKNGASGCRIILVNNDAAD